MILKDANGLSALQRSNWNSVVGTRNAIDFGKDMETKSSAFSPLVVVMISIDLSVPQPSPAMWSDSFIHQCVRDGRIYGTIGPETHIIVQIIFKNFAMSSQPPPSTSRSSHTTNTNPKINRKTTPNTPADNVAGSSSDVSKFNDFVCVVMVDSVGIGYSYNVPSNYCDQLVFRCISRLMEVALEKETIDHDSSGWF